MKRSMETDFFGTACRNLILDSALLWTLLGPHKRRYVFGKGVYETLLTKLDMGWMGKPRWNQALTSASRGFCHEIELVPYKFQKVQQILMTTEEYLLQNLSSPEVR